MDGQLQVSIKDIINLLGTNLYSDSRVVIRELIQNAYDSIKERYGEEAAKLGQIHIRNLPENAIEISDNGVGMGTTELTDYLSNMGKTLKKMSSQRNIGKYGIGFFSSFMISSTVVVETKKKNNPYYRWTSDGNEKYTLLEIDHVSNEPGTTVKLNLQRAASNFGQTAYLTNSINLYCDYLDCSIFCNGKQVNAKQFPWELSDKIKIMQSLKKHYDKEIKFFKYFKSKENDFECMLSLTDSGSYFELYSKRLFVTSDLVDVIPEELKFVRTLINSNSIELTLSRESKKNDPAWKAVVSTVGTFASEWIEDIASKNSEDPFILEIIKEYQPKFRKSALKNSSLFNSIYNLIAFNLSNFADKEVTIASYKKLFKTYDGKVYYNNATSSDKMATLLVVLKQKSIPVIEISNQNEGELLRKIANKISAYLVDIEVEGGKILEMFEERKSNNLLSYCQSILNKAVEFKSIDPDWMPMILTTDSIYLNSKNSFITELDNLTLTARNRKLIYQNFFVVFESIAQIQNSKTNLSAIAIRNIIHTFKNWIADLETSETLIRYQEYLKKWWSEQTSIYDLNSKRTFVIQNIQYSFRCFIVCPFKDKYIDVINQIKNTFAEKEIYAETAENINNISILRKVCSFIDQCDFALVDISENNPNVMLELGLLIARRKPAVIIRDRNVEIDQGILVPVDIISIERIEYTNTSVDLHAKLLKVADIINSRKNA